MAVAHDAQTRFPTSTTASDTTTGNRTFTHTPSGTPKGVVVVVCGTGTAAHVTGVLYGGVAMVSSAVATDTSEAGRVEVFTLTDQVVPTGAQTVTLQGCIAAPKYATCSTVTAATDGTTVNAAVQKNTTTGTNPTSTLTTTQTTLVYGGLHGGAAAPTSYVVGSGITDQHSMDYGALSSKTARRTSTAAAGSVLFNFTFGTSDDYCIAAVALAEFTLPPPVDPPTYPDSEDLAAGTGTRSFAPVTTSPGDFLVVGIQAESGAPGDTWTVSGGGGTFAVPSGADSGDLSNNHGRAIITVAEDTAGGTRTVQITPNSPGRNYRARVTVVHGSDGPGSAASTNLAQTVSLARSGANSGVLMGVTDWSAGAVGTPVWTPGGSTTASEQQAGVATYVFGRWDDSGAAGTAAHGISTPSYTTPAVAVLEMLGTAGGGGPGAVDGAATAIAASAFTAAATVTVPGAAASTAASAMTAAGAARVAGGAAMTAASNLTAAAGSNITGAASASAQSSLTAAAAVRVPGTASATATAAFSAAATIRVSGNSAWIAATTLSAAAMVRISGVAAMVTGSLLLANAGNTVAGVASAASATTFTAAGTIQVPGAAAAAAGSSLTAAASVRVPGAAAMTAASGLAVAGGLQITPGPVVMVAVSTLQAAGGVPAPFTVGRLAGTVGAPAIISGGTAGRRATTADSAAGGILAGVTAAASRVDGGSGR